MFWRYWRNNDARVRVERLARSRPWDRAAPRAAQPALQLQGMLGVGESKLLFELARTCFTGRGAVVDAGSFLGKSASLFAAGLLANAQAPAAMSKVHCFDSFRVHDSGTVEFIRERLGRAVAIGDSTRELFDLQVEPVRDMLEVHAGDFLEARWSAGSIELLLVDIAKSQQLWARVLEQMFPSLIPGISVIVHQDYHHAWLPHIQVVMEFLHPFFELVIPRIDASAVFLTKTSVPEEMLDRAIRYDFTPEERLRLMDSAIARMPSGHRFQMRCAKALMLCNDGLEPEQRIVEIDQIEQSCAATNSDCGQEFGNALALLASLRERSSKAIGWRALRTNDWCRALRIAEQLQDMEEDGDTVLMMGCSLIGLGRFQEAEAVLRRGPVAFTSASPYIPVELARAVLCQGRHDEAERIVVATLEQIGAEATDQSVLTRHVDVLLEVFAARGNRDRDRIAIEKLRRLFPGDSLIRR